MVRKCRTIQRSFISGGRSWKEPVHRWRNGSKNPSLNGELVSYNSNLIRKCRLLIEISLYYAITVCAEYPFLVLTLSMIFATFLGLGILRLEVTIDPVELWAAPTSRSRLEKDYFDESFTPFYRTEQVILHAEGLEGVNRLTLGR